MITLLRIIAASIWSIVMITSSILLMLLTFNRRLPVAMARNQWAPGILWICGIKLKISGIENLNLNEPYVFVANHQSYLDIPILFNAIPINLYFIAKKEIKWIPFIGWYMMATGMIFIDRSNRIKSIASLNKSAELVHAGKSVLLFPEGTRSRDGYLADFKKGPFKLAEKAEVPVVPVGIQDEGQPFKLNGLKITKVNVNIGTPSKKCELEHNLWVAQVHDEVANLSGRTKYLSLKK